jgi:thiol:disulfide interchange protein DsbD
VNSISVTGGTAATDDAWSSDFDSSMDNAVSEGRPVFIDFTGYTCSNCKAMESTVFPLQNVQQRFDQMEKVKLYTDGGEDAGRNQELQFELTGTLALPTYVILDPESGTVLDQLIGYTEAEKFESFLNRGLQRYQQIQNKES